MRESTGSAPGARVVKLRRSGVVALRPMIMPTNERERPRPPASRRLPRGQLPTKNKQRLVYRPRPRYGGNGTVAPATPVADHRLKRARLDSYAPPGHG